MTCKFHNFDGICDLWGDDMYEHIAISCDEHGHCNVDEDEDPTFFCEDFEER
jgi:hypothetical protein